MNRYSRISTSQFDPMTMQEVFSVPLAKQSQHDQLINQADATGLFEVPALEKDRNLVEDYKNQFASKLDELTQEVAKNGINNISKQKLKSLTADRNKWLSSGQGKEISSNYQAFVSNKEELDKMYQSGKISRDKYQMGIKNALDNYEGVANKGKYQSFNAVHDTDFQKKATEVAKAMQGNPQKISSFSGLQYDPRTGKYLDVKTKTERTEAGAIRQAVKAALMMDMDVMSDLNQRQQLGMLGDVDTGTYIDGLGLLNEEIYKVNNFDQTKQYTGIDQGQIDSRNQQLNSRNYELEPNQKMELGNNELLESLKTISSGGNTNFTGVPKYEQNKDGSLKLDQYGNAIVIADGEKATYNNMSSKVRAKYDLIYDKMKRQGILKGSKDDPSSIGAIQNYLESTKNLTHQQIKYTDGLMKTYEGRTSKVKRTEPSAIADGIANNPDNRVFIDKESGKEMQYEDLPKSVKEELDKRQARVTSVYSPRNFLNKEFDGILTKDAVASMIELQFSGNKKYLVSRSKSERNTPAYQADVKVNEIWSDINSTPNLENEFTLPGIGKTSITKRLDGSVLINNQGTSEIFTEDQMEMLINKLYNVSN